MPDLYDATLTNFKRAAEVDKLIHDDHKRSGPLLPGTNRFHALIEHVDALCTREEQAYTSLLLLRSMDHFDLKDTEDLLTKLSIAAHDIVRNYTGAKLLFAPARLYHHVTRPQSHRKQFAVQGKVSKVKRPREELFKIGCDELYSYTNGTDGIKESLDCLTTGSYFTEDMDLAARSSADRYLLMRYLLALVSLYEKASPEDQEKCHTFKEQVLDPLDRWLQRA